MLLIFCFFTGARCFFVLAIVQMIQLPYSTTYLPPQSVSSIFLAFFCFFLIKCFAVSVFVSRQKFHHSNAKIQIIIQIIFCKKTMATFSLLAKCKKNQTHHEFAWKRIVNRTEILSIGGLAHFYTYFNISRNTFFFQNAVVAQLYRRRQNVDRVS